MAVAIFKGSATSALDSKGRFSLPVAFRNILAQTCDSAGTVQLRADPKRPYLSLFGDQMLQDFQAEIDRKADFAASRGEDFDREMAESEAFGAIEEAGIDSGGRFSVPAKMRSYYGLTEGAFLVGSGRIVQLWSPQRFLDRPDVNPMHVADCEAFIAELAKKGAK